jgi:hypothetical protein
MRNYEFRTWDIKKKKMLPYLSVRRDGTTIAMQYIGKTDYKGDKIFEGDRVEWYMPELDLSGDGEIMYSETLSAYVVLDSKQGLTMPLYRIKSVLIIGNVYESDENKESEEAV